MFTAKQGLWILGMIFLLTPSLWALHVDTTVPPFQVFSQDGEPLTEQDLRGKITVLFYDTRRTAAVNNDLKYEISDFRETNLPFLENLQVVQIIDASSANFLTRAIWRRKLRQNARKYGITLYADWDGTMRRDFGFSPRESNILVVDPQGMVRYSFLGKVTESEKSRLFVFLLTLGKENKEQTQAKNPEVTTP
ncbi:MAG: redoxin domain-containing protein [Candidatus Atribacteria bacterium]|nr:redoxin domain-containing protein [Candidatus Atribacteria bacterium]